MVEILSQNVRGLGQEFKRRKIFNWLQKSKAAIFFLQETHSSPKCEKTWRSEWGNKNIFFSHGESNARGVCILFKASVAVEIHNQISDEFGRFLIVEATIDSKRLALCNVYGPNNDDPSFFVLVNEEITSLNEDNRIIGGDFNCILDSDLDKQGGNPNRNKKSREMLNIIMEENDLNDIWRIKNPDNYEYTFRCMRPEKIFSRLDYFLISSGICDLVEDVCIAPGYLSDHSNIRMKLNMVENPRGKGFWKLNCQLLYDKEYIDLIKDTITNISAINRDVDPHLLWETIKVAIRSSTIEYSSRKKKVKENTISALEHRLKRLELLLSSAPSENVERSINAIKEELDTYIAEKTRGAMVRSRARWVEEGEHSTKYFFNLEKRNYNNKTLQCIRKSDGTISSDSNEILEELQAFYNNLYMSKFVYDTPDFEIFHGLDRPLLNEQEQENLERPLDDSEILYALKSCKNNKTPGSDGLPAEFYKVFWQDIKQFLIASYNYTLEEKRLSQTQRQGVITLIPKKDKDVLLVKNWRPLSLLNMDYKLLAKVTGNRIKKVIEKLIHSNQTGFIGGRYIGENLVKILSILEHCEDNDIPAVLIAIDFEKAYDSVEWSAVEYALKFFNFGPRFTQWVQTFYKDINSCVINNGHFSKFFQLQRGVRQGCPLSPYIYIIVAELLSIMIRSDQDIEGISINGIQYKIFQFADDTCSISRFTKRSLNAIFRAFDHFERVTGLKINYDKTEILRIGSLRDTEAKIYTQKPVNWTNEPLLILGIYVTQSKADLFEENFPQLLVKLQNMCKLWTMRDLTIYGKVLITKSLLISQLVYKLSILPTPKLEYLKEVNNIINKFVWNGKPPKIAKKILMLPLDKGGVKYSDISIQERALKIAWVKRIIEGENEELRNLVRLVIPDCKQAIWKANLRQSDTSKIIKNDGSGIWGSVLGAWCAFNYKEPNSPIEILNQSLWYNSNIRRQDRPFMNRNLYNLGLHNVHNIVGIQGNILPFTELAIFNGRQELLLQYNQLVGAIPQKWKQILLQNIGAVVQYPIASTNLDEVCKAEKVTRYVYHKIIDALPIDASRRVKWGTEINMNIEEQEWLGFFAHMYESTYYNKLRFLQYRLLYRILVTNIHRYCWGQIDSDLCTFCGVAPESYLHLFCQCEYTRILWTKFFVWLARVSGLKLNYGENEILFGITNNNPIDKLINTLLLIVKQYIYSVKCQKRVPNLNELYKRIYKVMLVEKYLAQKNNKIHRFDEKWGIIEW